MKRYRIVTMAWLKNDLSIWTPVSEWPWPERVYMEGIARLMGDPRDIHARITEDGRNEIARLFPMYRPIMPHLIREAG